MSFSLDAYLFLWEHHLTQCCSRFFKLFTMSTALRINPGRGQWVFPFILLLVELLSSLKWKMWWGQGYVWIEQGTLCYIIHRTSRPMIQVSTKWHLRFNLTVFSSLYFVFIIPLKCIHLLSKAWIQTSSWTLTFT